MGPDPATLAIFEETWNRRREMVVQGSKANAIIRDSRSKMPGDDIWRMWITWSREKLLAEKPLSKRAPPPPITAAEPACVIEITSLWNESHIVRLIMAPEYPAFPYLRLGILNGYKYRLYPNPRVLQPDSYPSCQEGQILLPECIVGIKTSNESLIVAQLGHLQYHIQKDTTVDEEDLVNGKWLDTTFAVALRIDMETNKFTEVLIIHNAKTENIEGDRCEAEAMGCLPGFETRFKVAKIAKSYRDLRYGEGFDLDESSVSCEAIEIVPIIKRQEATDMA